MQYVNAWAQAHPGDVARFIKQNPGNPKPGAVDLAAAFFTSFSKENPGRFPGLSTRPGTPIPGVGPISEGTDIQSIFFDMWRQDNPGVELEDVPGDMVTTSASGLDPHITFENAEFQLDRVASKWAQLLHRNPAQTRQQILRILQANAFSPLKGLAGDKLINVLKVNVQLQRQFAPAL